MCECLIGNEHCVSAEAARCLGVRQPQRAHSTQHTTQHTHTRQRGLLMSSLLQITREVTSTIPTKIKCYNKRSFPFGFSSRWRPFLLDSVSRCRFHDYCQCGGAVFESLSNPDNCVAVNRLLNVLSLIFKSKFKKSTKTKS